MRRLIPALSIALLMSSTVVPQAAAADAPDQCVGATSNSTQAAWLQESIGTATDVDWYRFATTASRTVLVTLGNLPVDYRLDLYSACATHLASSNRSGQQVEEIVRLLPAGTYRVRVSGVAGAYNAIQYRLKFRAFTPGMPVLSAVPFVVGSQLHLIGEVLNTTTGNRSAVKVTAKLYGSGDTLLGGLTGPAYRWIVPAGGRTPFHLVTAVPPDFHHATFTVVSSVALTAPMGNLTVTPGAPSLDGSTLHYPGSVANGNGFNVAEARVIVTAYNATGSVLTAGIVPTSPSAIAAHQSAVFDFMTSRHAGTNRWAFVAQAKGQT